MSDLRVRVASDVRNPIVVSASQYRGLTRLDIRHNFTDEGGELRPTKKGVSIPIADAQALVMALETAVAPADNTKTVAEVDADVREPLFVSVEPYKGKMRLDVRHYFGDRGELRPGIKGVNVPWQDRDALLAAVREVIGELVAA